MSYQQDTTFEVTHRQTHACGQVHTTTQTLKVDEAFTLSYRRQEQPSLREQDGGVFRLPDGPDTTLTLTGHLAKTTLSGIELKEHALRCVRCGEDILFPPDPTDTASPLLYHWHALDEPVLYCEEPGDEGEDRTSTIVG